MEDGVLVSLQHLTQMKVLLVSVRNFKRLISKTNKRTGEKLADHLAMLLRSSLIISKEKSRNSHSLKDQLLWRQMILAIFLLK
jgi:hypothetical protein